MKGPILKRSRLQERSASFVVLAVILAALAASLPAACAETTPAAPVLIVRPHCTDFNNSQLSGWGACPPPQDNVTVAIMAPTLQLPSPSGATTDLFLHVKDKSNASLVCSGRDFHGDWMAATATGCATFCFDVRLDVDGLDGGTLETIHPHFTIRSGTLSATFTANIVMTEPGGSNPGWHHICAPLGPLSNGNLPSGPDGVWTISTLNNQDWNKLLANVTAVEIPIDYTSNPAEEADYDNFCLNKGDCPPCFLCGVITASCCLGVNANGQHIYSFLATVIYQPPSPPANCNLSVSAPAGTTVLTFAPSVLAPGLNYLSGTVAFTGQAPGQLCLTLSCGPSPSCQATICGSLQMQQSPCGNAVP